MSRFALAACLLLLPGLAAAQEGEFAQIFNGSTGQVFPLRNPNEFVGEANAVAEIPLRADAVGTEASAPLVTVEEEGVRLPDEQFALD